MQIKDLKPNVRNPRKISEKKLEALKKSVEKFGDLSGFVYNRRTKQLVSGHQRSKTIPPNATIKIEVKHDTPTKACTVAEGYVLVDGERFKYREVDADPQWEVEALLAANKHGGEWDRDTMRLLMTDFPEMNIEMAGFDLDELARMDIRMPKMSANLNVTHRPAPTDESVLNESQDFDVLSSAQDNSWGSDEDADAAYMSENPGPDSALSKEDISMNAFSSVEEKTENKQMAKILVVIELDSVEGRDRLKEALRTAEFNLGQYGARMF